MNKEIRFYETEMRGEVPAESDGKKAYNIVGRPIVFKVDTDLGYFTERIDPNALTDTDMKDVRLLVNHDNSMIPLARSRNNNGSSTMHITVDEDGMNVRASLAVETNPKAAELYSAIERGDVTGMSFAFTVDEDSWEDIDTDHPKRTITKIGRVFEVSAVTYPAYQQTSIDIEPRAEALESAKAVLESAREARMEMVEMPVEETPVESEEVRSESVETETVEAVVDDRSEEIEQLEQRKADLEAINAGAPVKVIEAHNIENQKVEEKNMFDRSTPEYRSAFIAMLAGNANAEQRGIFADSTSGTYGDGIALPVAVENAIWDQVCTAHPIMADISILRSGIMMKIPQITPTVPSKKKDSAATSELTYTTNEVILAGADYHTFVTLSYAERQMSSAALEQLLIAELATVIGEAIAKDVFARILTDLSSTPAVTKSSSNTWLDCLKLALAAASKANAPVVYAPASLYYEVLGAVDTNGQPVFRNGLLLNAQFKLDNAATKVTVVDPKMFVLNMIQDVNCKVADDVKAAEYVIGGYARAEGCMRVVAAASYIG